MNILFIYPRMFHPHRGGIERVSDSIARELVCRGHRVFYLHNIREEVLLDYPYPAPLSFFPFPIQEAAQNGLFYKNFLEENQIDIVINQDPCAYYSLGRYSKAVESVKVISVCHASPLSMYDYLFSLTMRLRNDTWIEKIKRVARIIKVPKIKYDYWQRLKLCYDESLAYTDLLCLLSMKFLPELKWIHPGDEDRVIAIANPNTYPPQNVVKARKKRILYVGRITWYQKRVDRLLTIWKYLYRDFPDWELVFVGDGPLREELERKSSKMERVTFVGYKDPDAYYKDASILCLTSDNEGWGMVLTEAMTFGVVPVVFNSFASVTDIIEDGKTGVLVPPFSCKRFARRLGMLMKDEERRAAMSEACARSVRRFDIQSVADRWEAVFEELKKKKD